MTNGPLEAELADSRPHVADCTIGFSPLGTRRHTRDVVSIELTEHTYLPDGELTSGWFPNIVRAFRTAADRLPPGPRSFGTIGVGPGLEAILAVELLDAIQVFVSDVHQDVADTAVSNVLRNCPGLTPDRVTGFTADLCTGFIERGITVDVLYENLPNLPISELSIDNGVTTASFFGERRLAAIPAIFAEHRLPLHYLFLQQASRCLRPGGGVICCIGGRVPIDIVRQMFHDSGFVPSVLNFDIVRQFESERVLSGYAAAEAASGIRFRFYPYEPSAHLLSDIRGTRATVEEAIADPRFAALAIRASAAQDLEHGGTAIGHLGVVWYGTPIR
jgi:methylase of polypeptide subunit release factors